ncbi:MAG: glycosyl hydrolase-related protein [Clostridiales bacterium]|nr:glycosyl hydrolase-related protein [Clostridiales bacterium]
MIEIIKNLVAGMAKHPIILRRVLKIKEKVYEKIAPLTVTAVTSDEPIKKSDLYKYEEKPVKEGFCWAEEKFGACWFHVRGQVPAEYASGHNAVIMNIGGEGLAYDGDETVDIITPILSVSDVLQPPTAGKRVLEIVKPDGQVDALIDCGYNGYNGKFINGATLKYAYIAKVHDDISKYYYDYVTIALLLCTADKNRRIDDKLQKEIKNILCDSYDEFSKGNLSAAEDILKKYYEKKQDYDSVTYTLIGHAHLDLAWLWPERESKRKAVRTFTNAISTIEKNDGYVFGASQAQMFEWVKESHPALFEKIKKRVADGSISLQGGMWVESDCNMPSGESLIRQFCYGDKFFLDNFGKTSDTVWLPDAFGFPATLPQIIKGVGKDNFATIKITWNKNKFPYQSFYWVAPDGSKVLSHVSPEGTYCNDGTPLAIEKSERKNIQKETKEALIIYGVGDGGGGPGEGHVKIAERCKNLYGTAKTKMQGTDEFFDELAKSENLPEYKGELYLEKHQGTYTSQSENKRLNRLAERELHLTEWLCAVAGKNADLDRLWKRLLFSQFHDVLPGSSIERVHKESREDLTEVAKKAREKSDEIIASLSGGDGVSAINPSPFSRREYINVNGESYLFDGVGYSAKPIEKSAPTVKVGKNFLENESIILTFGSDGEIVSYYDKITDKELSRGGLNLLTIYKDKKLYYNAWDIDKDYVKYPENLKSDTVKTFIDGGRAVAEITYRYGKSVIKQFVSVSSGKTVRVDNEINWAEKNKMLRALFYPSIYADKAECDIQFGSIERSAKNETSIEKEQFEVCAHKYVSVKNKDGVFAVISDCKYGYRIKENAVSLNLLRSPKYPDPNCDMGTHKFSYAFGLYADEKETVKEGYNFNYPLVVVDKKIDISPVATFDCDDVIIETIKRSFDGEYTVVRAYERFGKTVDTAMKINIPYKEILVSDLEENNRKAATENFTFSPHEIKTILIK